MKTIMISGWNPEWYIIHQEGDNSFSKNILWTDEDTYKMNKCVNRLNYIYLVSDNPRLVIEEILNDLVLTLVNQKSSWMKHINEKKIAENIHTVEP